MGGIEICRIDTGAGSSFLEGSGTGNFISRLTLSNNSLYNLYSFVWESVHLRKCPLSKMVYVELKMIFPSV